MARKTVKKVAQKMRKSQLVDPKWDGCEKWSGEKFHRAKISAHSHYYEHYKLPDLQDFCYHWMRDNDYTKDQIRAAKADKSHQISHNVGYNCRMLTMGMPNFHKAENEYWISLLGTGGEVKPITDWIVPRIERAIENGKEHVEEQEAKRAAEADKNKNIYKPSIKELMFEASCRMTDEIEEFVDSFDAEDSAELKKFDPAKMLRAVSAKAGHARIIRKFYEGELGEFTELNTKVSKKDMDDMREQLEEGYAHLSTKGKKNMLELYRKIVDACDITILESKSQRKPRKIKAKSADDLVKKLQLKTSDSSYGIASVPATGLIGCNIAMVFNTKTRKLGLYYASNVDPKGLQREGSGLTVKGTTIQGFDPEKSIQKTVRKPAELLPQIKKTTRSKTVKLFDTLKTTETKLNGRMNKDIILLGTFNN
jgi:hypothetical protein